MKRFITNIIIAFSGVFLAHLLLAFCADGNSDGFYARLSSGKQSSLIIGTSRAAQGILPKEINEELSLDPKLYNFSFSLDNSPFGEVYLKAIKSKLKKNTNDGIFIVAVNPWSIAEDTDDKSKKIDSKSLLFNLNRTSGKPNLEYLVKNYKRGWGNILIKKFETRILQRLQKDNSKLKGSSMFVHEDGWLEVSTSIEPSYLANNIEKKTKTYIDALGTHKFSDYRYNYLVKTIEFLQERGTVYLVRLPVHDKLIQIEKQLMPEFDSKMNSIGLEKNIEYLNFLPKAENYVYTDGNHLYKTSAKLVSQEIAEYIKLKD